MENFLNYDQFRLSQYKNRKEQIDFGETNSYYYYRFDEVDYFNYLFFKTTSYNSQELLDLFSKYQLNGKIL